jgi:quercetin dioxygenase-like cupin family protein
MSMLGCDTAGRDSAKVPPHWHSFDEPITVLSGTWVMGLGERFDLAAAREFPAGSFLVVPKGVPHFAWCEGETTVQGHGIGPLDTTSFALKTTREALEQ